MRFSILQILIVTGLIAAMVAFLLPLRQSQMQKRGRQWVASQRGHVWFENRVGEKSRAQISDSKATPPTLLVALLGVDYFNSVNGVMLDCEEVDDLGPISDLQSLRNLVINIEIADDLDFGPLARLPNLEYLHFTEWAGVSENQLTQLRDMLPNVKIESD